MKTEILINIKNWLKDYFYDISFVMSLLLSLFVLSLSIYFYWIDHQNNLEFEKELNQLSLHINSLLKLK